MKSKTKLISLVVVCTALLAVCCTAAAVFILKTDKSNDLPVLFDAPKFSLIDQDGKPFGTDQLRGKVWVSDFIFTSCMSVCPIMTQHMAGFQKVSTGMPVQMVSFSVDPETDTPAVLKGYAHNAGADESRWHFLTGTKAQTWEVSKGMMLAVGPDKGNQVLHSSKIILVDGDGKVRGLYDTTAKDFDAKKIADDAAKIANAQ